MLILNNQAKYMRNAIFFTIIMEKHQSGGFMNVIQAIISLRIIKQFCKTFSQKKTEIN